MPFQKVERGNKEFQQITFGTGDIKIAPASESAKEPLTMIFLVQDVPKDESKWDKQPSTWRTTDDFTTDAICLKFNKVKSIDMLIETLLEVKDSMLYNEKGGE